MVQRVAWGAPVMKVWVRVSECWMFYAVQTARVIFRVKTSLDVFSLRLEQVFIIP